MKDPLVSIIVPVYKVEEYLDECVESIVCQTYKNLEIILVDDGSPDRCPEMCDRWAEKESRIKVIHRENAGASAARNSGLEIATGDYLAFVDADDYIASTMFEELLRAIRSSDRKMACCTAYRGETRVSSSHFQVKMKIMDVKEAVNALFYHDINIAVWSKLFSKDLFQDIRFPEGEVNEEVPIMLPLIVKAQGIVDIGQALYYYRPREASITHSYHLNGKHCEQVYNNLKRIRNQIDDFQLPCRRSYRFFAAYHAFSLSLVMEKNLNILDQDVRMQYGKIRKLLKTYALDYVFSGKSSMKNKVLYCLVLWKLLRPVYKIMNKELK